MITGRIGYKNPGIICFLPKKVNAEYYKKILEKEKTSFDVLSEGNPIFQEDNASIHNTKIVKYCFSDNI